MAEFVSTPEEIDALAAEFVLGTLTPEERRDFLRLMARNAEAALAVRHWQERLAPLAMAIEPVAPPPALLGRIEAAIADTPAAVVRPRPANDNGGRWRIAAIAAALVAVVTSGIALREPGSVVAPGPQTTAPQPVQTVAFRPGTSIAALSEKGQTPGLFVTYDRNTGKLRVIPIGLTEDEQHSLELWLIQGKDAPKPMGLIDPKKGAERGTKLDTGTDATFAVSVEPVGGSPTGAPTGPVIYSGALVHLPVES